MLATTYAATGVSSSSSMNGSPLSGQNSNLLPEKVLVAYTTNHCNDLDDMSKVTKAVEEGVNVLIWSFISFEVVNDNHEGKSNTKSDNNNNDMGQNLRIKVSQNLDNYKKYRKKLIEMGHDSIKHLVAFGGWNGPHLPPGYSGSELYQVFKKANLQKLVGDEKESGNNMNVFTEFQLWDGIDWDLEGNDTLQSPRNEFTLELLNQVGDFSQAAKDDDLIVSMAPPESYLDTTSNKFSRFVNLKYANDEWHQDFQYHGWNVYAYIMAKYGEAIDFVFVQFYESYSHALYQTEMMGMSQSDFLVQYIESLSEKGFGYTVNFEDDNTIDLKNQIVKLPLSKIVFGFANGWGAGSEKAIFFNPSEVKKAYIRLGEMNLVPRGCGYWVVEEEGNEGVYLTRELNAIVNANDNTNGLLDGGSSKTY